MPKREGCTTTRPGAHDPTLFSAATVAGNDADEHDPEEQAGARNKPPGTDLERLAVAGIRQQRKRDASILRLRFFPVKKKESKERMSRERQQRAF
jgi:hypothetical protein